MIARRRFVHLSIAAALGLGLAALAPATAAAQSLGSVSGTVAVAPGAGQAAPERNRGFVPRAANPLKPPRPFDPLPHLVVVLEGGPVADADRQPPREPVRYAIIGESFDRPVLPIVSGATVELKNEGKRALRLVAPAQPDLIAGDPINPRGVRMIKKLELASKALELRDPDAPHVSGRLVVLPHAYFARLDDGGRFQIKGVPAGEWRVRLWYRDGFLAGAGASAAVSGNRDAAVKLTVPAKLEVEAAGGG